MGCLGNLMEPSGVKQTGSAQVTFQSSSGNALINEKAATYLNTTKAYSEITANLQHCRTIKTARSGHVLTGTVAAMSFPAVGQASKAFQVTLHFEVQTLAESLVIARVGNVILGIDYGGLPGYSLTQFEGITKVAVSDAEKASRGGGKSTPVVTQPSKAPQSISFKDLNGNPYIVTEMSVIDPAKGADQFTLPNAGNRFVAVKVKVTDTGSKQISDDANLNMTIVGSDGQTYSADFSNVLGCTNFDSGSYHLSSQQSSVGCVVFQVPVKVKVSDVEWSPSGGFGSSFGTWKVG